MNHEVDDPVHVQSDKASTRFHNTSDCGNNDNIENYELENNSTEKEIENKANQVEKINNRESKCNNRVKQEIEPEDQRSGDNGQFIDLIDREVDELIDLIDEEVDL